LTDAEASTLETQPTVTDALSLGLDVIKRVLKPRCFVAMRIREHPLPTAFEIIRAAAAEVGYHAVRVDQEVFVGSVVDEIWGHIRHSDVVIADLTGDSPNVYYELGISHALNKPTVLLVFNQNGDVPSTIPFDISVQRILPYGTEQSLRLQIKRQLSNRLLPLNG
jgi:hypothetical protein